MKQLTIWDLQEMDDCRITYGDGKGLRFSTVVKFLPGHYLEAIREWRKTHPNLYFLYAEET